MRFGWAAAIIYDDDDDSQECHVVPVDDLRDHDLSPICWCDPVMDDDEYCIWVHNAMDRREDYETDRMKH